MLNIVVGKGKTDVFNILAPASAKLPIHHCPVDRKGLAYEVF
jgi:hypothetical protein